MHTNHEIEYKTLISASVYQTLCHSFPDAVLIDQTNIYYESTSMSLKAAGLAVRIREINGKHLFTMKQKASEGHHEYELYLDENSPAAFNHPELLKLFETLNVTGPFVQIGSLHTIRRSIHLNYGELCLDENEYCGIKDYEVEFEIDITHPQEAKQEFEQLMNQFQISYTQAVPKRTRCLNQMNKENAK